METLRRLRGLVIAHEDAVLRDEWNFTGYISSDSGALEAVYQAHQRGLRNFSMLVTHVLVHEIGHHFGFSDADMDAIERQAG